MTEVIHESEKTFRNQTMAVLAPINHSETIPGTSVLLRKK